MRLTHVLAAAAGTAAIAGGGVFVTQAPGTDKTGSGATEPRKEMDDAKLVKHTSPSVVRLIAADGYSEASGTGVVIDAKQGLVLTNSHVVAGASTLKAQINGRKGDVPVQPWAQAPCDDVAIVKLTTVPPGLRAAKLGSSSRLQPLQDVVALGFPGGLEDEPTLNVTSGEVSKSDIEVNTDGHVAPDLPEFQHVVQHTAEIDHGNSGGPLVNRFGEIVGINSLGYNQQAWAISSDYIRTMLPDLLKRKSRQYTGWGAMTTADARDALGFGFGAALADGRGLFVTGVDANSPAMAARIQPGDVILSMNGMPVDTVAQACDVLRSQPPGGTVPIELRELERDASGEPLVDAFGTPVYRTGPAKITLQA